MLRTSLLATFALSAPAALAQDLYDPTVVRSFNFTFHDANWWALLQANYTSQTNILADLEVDGVTYPNVGVRIRGNTSYTQLPAGSQKVSLNVDMEAVDPNQALMGYSTLNLNNAFTDPTFCREVAYSNFISRYIPNGRGNHVLVTLNGQNWGVYTNIQQWNKDVLREWFDDEDGMRVKCANNPNGPGLRYVGASQSLYTGYEIKDAGGLADPWGTLINICWWVTNGSLATWQDIDNVFALDPSIWDVALENLFADDDSYINKGADFVLYRDPSDGRAHLQQTDGNETFKQSSWAPTHNFTATSKPVLQRLMQVPELRQRYMAHLRTALTEFNWALLGTEFAGYYSRIDAHVQSDPKKLYTYQQFLTNLNTAVTLSGGGPGGGTVTGLQQFVNTRLALMNSNAEVSAPAPFVTGASHAPSDPYPWEQVWVTANVAANQFPVAKVELFYRAAPGRYLVAPMFDDGVHQDGVAGDGVYGALLPITATAGQRVKYYVGATSSNSYGSLTFFPRRTELAPLSLEYQFGSSGMRITEYMYSGANGEFIELTNTSNAAIDLTGWSLDDDSQIAGTYSLSAAGLVQPGQSVLVTDAVASTFSTAWGLSGVTVLGSNTAANFGRNDQVNIYDAQGALVERLSYGDESFPGSIRTQNKSGQTCVDALGTNNPFAWSLASLGDAWGSRASTGGDLGSPGTHVVLACNLPVGTSYCAALPNGSGSTASLSAVGSAAAATQNLTLNVTGANPSTPGYFIWGSTAVQVPFGNGFRCVGGGIVRMPPLQVADSAGAASLAVDFLDPYAATFAAGVTVNFQYWYRDAGSSNFSNGLRVDFH